MTKTYYSTVAPFQFFEGLHVNNIDIQYNNFKKKFKVLHNNENIHLNIYSIIIKKRYYYPPDKLQETVNEWFKL